MTYPLLTKSYSASSDFSLSRSSSGSPPSFTIKLNAQDKKKLCLLFKEAKASLEEDLRACLDNNQLRGKYERVTAYELLRELPVQLTKESPPVHLTLDPNTKNVMGNRSIFESRVSTAGIDLDSPYTYTPGYVRSIKEIQDLFNEYCSLPTEWEAMLLIAEAVGAYANKEFVNEFQDFAISFAFDFLFSRTSPREQKGVILSMHRFLSSLSKERIDPVLEFSRNVAIELIKREKESKSLVKFYPLTILFLKEFEKLGPLDNLDWVKECIDCLMIVWEGDTQAIKELKNAFASEKQSELIFSMKVMLERTTREKHSPVKAPLLTPSLRPFLPRDALFLKQEEGSSPESESAIPLIPLVLNSPIGAASERAGKQPCSAFDEDLLILSSDERSCSSSAREDSPAPELPDEMGEIEDVRKHTRPSTPVAPDPMAKIHGYLNTPRLGANSGLLEQLLGTVAQMATLDASLWEKVIEAVSKSKSNHVKEKLWQIWTSAEKGNMALEKINKLWRMTRPLLFGLEPKALLEFYNGRNFVELLNRLSTDKDNSQINGFYSDIFARAAKHGDPESLLRTFCRHIGEVAGLNKHTLFKTDLLPLLEKVSKKANPPIELILAILQENSAALENGAVCQNVLRIVETLLQKEGQYGPEEENNISSLLAAIVSQPAMDRTKLIETLSKLNTDEFSDTLLRIVTSEIIATFENKRIKEAVKKKLLGSLVTNLEMSLDKASGIAYLACRGDLLKAVERMEDLIKTPLDQIWSLILRHEIDTKMPDTVERFQFLGTLWKKILPDDKSALADLLIFKCIEFANEDNDVDKVASRCKNIIDYIFTPSKKVLVNRKLEKVYDDTFSIRLLDEILIRTEIEFPEGNSSEVSEASEKLALRKKYCNVVLRLLDTPHYHELMNEIDNLQLVLNWSLWTLFDKNQEGVMPLVKALDDIGMAALCNTLEVAYGSPEVSCAIEAVMDVDEDSLETIEESLELMMEHCSDKANGLFHGYISTRYTGKQDEGYTLEKIRESIYRLTNFMEVAINITEVTMEMKKTILKMGFKSFIDLITIYLSFRVHIAEQERAEILLDIRNVYHSYVNIIESQILSEIIFWNNTGKTAVQSDLSQIFESAEICKEAAELTAEVISKGNNDNYALMINVLYETVRLAMCSMTDSSEKKALLNTAMECIYKKLPFVESDHPIYGGLPDLHWIAENEGLDSEYIPSRIFHKVKESRQVTSDYRFDFAGRPDLARASILNLAEGFMKYNTVKSACMLLMSLENANLECFSGESHALPLALVVNSALAMIGRKLENPAIVEMLKKFRIITLVNTLVLNPIAPNASHSQGWLQGKQGQMGIAALTGTDNQVVNDSYETHLQSVARMLLELYLAYKKPSALSGAIDHASLLNELCVFPKLLVSIGVINPEKILDLDDRSVLDKLDDLGLSSAMDYHSMAESENKRLFAALLSFSRDLLNKTLLKPL